MNIRANEDISIDLLIPKPQQVAAGKKRPGAFNARFPIVMVITLRGITDKKLLATRSNQEFKQLPPGTVRLEIAMDGNLANRDANGDIKWNFAKKFGNVSACRCNRTFGLVIQRLLKEDGWVQLFCKPVEKQEMRKGSSSSNPQASDLQEKEASS